jgi:hypothetical protein
MFASSEVLAGVLFQSPGEGPPHALVADERAPSSLWRRDVSGFGRWANWQMKKKFSKFAPATQKNIDRSCEFTILFV